MEKKKNQHKPAVFSFNLLAKRTKLQQENMHSFNAAYHYVTYFLDAKYS